MNNLWEVCVNESLAQKNRRLTLTTEYEYYKENENDIIKFINDINNEIKRQTYKMKYSVEINCENLTDKQRGFLIRLYRYNDYKVSEINNNMLIISWAII